MAKFIEVMTSSDQCPILINVDHICEIYPTSQSQSQSQSQKQINTAQSIISMSNELQYEVMEAYSLIKDKIRKLENDSTRNMQ